MASFSDASWLYAAYFAVAWLLLIGVIVRPAQVTRQSAGPRGGRGAVYLRNRLSPVDYLFLGAVSGLVFGASEVVHYITSGVEVGQVGAGILILSYVWRFLTDPITHACWAGLTGYFIGLAVSGPKWHRVAWIGLAMAMILHGLNDWDAINGRATWVAVVAVSGILFLGYAKAPAHPAMPVHHSSSLAGIGVPPSGIGVPPTGIGMPPSGIEHPVAEASGSPAAPVPLRPLRPRPPSIRSRGPKNGAGSQQQPPPPSPSPGTPQSPSAHHPPTVTVPPSPRKKPWWEE